MSIESPKLPQLPKVEDFNVVASRVENVTQYVQKGIETIIEVSKKAIQEPVTLQSSQLDNPSKFTLSQPRTPLIPENIPADTKLHNIIKMEFLKNNSSFTLKFDNEFRTVSYTMDEILLNIQPRKKVDRYKLYKDSLTQTIKQTATDPSLTWQKFQQKWTKNLEALINKA